MYGPAFLVNPITQPGTIDKEAYLPNSRWYDFWTGDAFQGPGTVVGAAPLERLPLYVRGGSIVPMGPAMEWTSEKPADPIELRVYAGADGDFTLYEDEGDTYHYEKGAHAEIPMHWNDADRELTIGDRHGSFPTMLEQRTFRVVIVKKDHGVGIDASATSDKDVAYTGKALTVAF
jgi:alpha-D-xyloside xylohydrolase